MYAVLKSATMNVNGGRSSYRRISSNRKGKPDFTTTGRDKRCFNRWIVIKVGSTASKTEERHQRCE